VHATPESAQAKPVPQTLNPKPIPALAVSAMQRLKARKLIYDLKRLMQDAGQPKLN
jgi:hypothetical protein